MSPDPLGDLLGKYRAYRATTLLDCAAAAAGLTVELVTAPDIDPLLAKAIASTSPSFDPTASYSPAELLGVTNAAKGKYFEYLVAERLNDGQSVGDLLLPSGFRAELADSMTQPGWDLRIVDEHGYVSDYLQLKATDSISYIQAALTRYPDIRIMATSEVAGAMDVNHMVLDTSMSEQDILVAVQEGVGDGGGFLDHFWDSFHPVIPLLIIASMNGYQVVMGKRSVRDAVEISKARVQRAFVATGTGAIVKTIGGGWLAIPAAMLAGYLITRHQQIDELITELSRQRHKHSLMAAHYRNLQGNIA